mgnify:CR=1 FL=1
MAAKAKVKADKNGKVKSSIYVDGRLWIEWMSFCVKKEGTTRKSIKHIQQALVEHMIANGWNVPDEIVQKVMKEE